MHPGQALRAGPARTRPDGVLLVRPFEDVGMGSWWANPRPAGHEGESDADAPRTQLRGRGRPCSNFELVAASCVTRPTNPGHVDPTRGGGHKRNSFPTLGAYRKRTSTLTVVQRGELRRGRGATRPGAGSRLNVGSPTVVTGPQAGPWGVPRARGRPSRTARPSEPHSVCVTPTTRSNLFPQAVTVPTRSVEKRPSTRASDW